MKARIGLFFFLLFALPLSGFCDSTLNFPKLFTAAELGTSGFATVNPSATAASVQFTLYSAAGAQVGSPSTQTIPARGNLTKLGSELFPSPGSGGWIQATSTTTGLTGFWLSGDFVNFMDGAEAAAPGQEFVFPLATATTELNVVNLAASSNLITIRLYNATGTELATAVTATVAVKGVYKNTLTTIFPSVNFSNAMYVKVTGSGVITGTTVAVDFIYAPSWSVINGIETSTTTTEVNFGHALSGPDWQSILGVTNLTTSTNNLTITYTPNTGSPVTVSRSLSSRGSLREAVKDLFSFGSTDVDGWVKVTATAPLAGFLSFGYAPQKAVAVVPMQAVGQTQLIFSHVANGPSWGTGLALLNPTTTDAVVEVYVMRSTGALVGGAADQLTATINLAAGTQSVKLIDELVSASHADDGLVYIRSVNNVPLYAFQLFFSRDVKELSNVAAGTIDPSITFTPPVPTGTIVPLTPLTITTLTPSAAARAATVTIVGTGFSTTAASNTVVFTTASGSATATAATATATTLTVVVPSTAISGPVYVTTGSRYSTSAVLTVNATATTLLTPNSVTVTASHNTAADIYVGTSSTSFNGYAVGITDTSASSVSMGSSAVEATVGTTRRLWLTGDGITSSTTVTISGSGITVSSSGVTSTGYVIVHITIAAGATTGPRNIILTNAGLDQSIITGGLILR